MADRKAILALDFDEVFILEPVTPTAKGAYTDRARNSVTVKLDHGLVGTGGGCLVLAPHDRSPQRHRW